MNTRTCPLCTNGRVKHYRSGFATQIARCGACKGTTKVSAATWLRMFYAAPRGPMTRARAITLACDELGLRPNGSDEPTSNGCNILANGAGGLVADLRAQGFGDVADRFKTAYLARRTCETAEGFEAFIAEVEAARAEITARVAA